METPSDPINPTDIDEIIQVLIERLKATYVFPDIAEQICHVLEKNLAQGTFNDITQPETFAQILTEQIQSINHDEHLRVRWSDAELPEQNDSLLRDPAYFEELRQQAELDNFGIHKAERLPGNVGYLDIHRFHRPEWGAETAVAAMNFLANTSALIIDLRQCGGGSPEMVALISSYLFDSEPVHLNSLYWRNQDRTHQYWTLPYVPGKRYPDKPVYVLTSNYTFSGGEEFAYNLKTRQRAILVGETTHGGAHPGSVYRLQAHFEVFIPNGRAINPITRDNWEGKGVIPHIQAPKDQAFQIAYRKALQLLLNEIGTPTTPAFKLLAEEVGKALEQLDSENPA